MRMLTTPVDRRPAGVISAMNAMAVSAGGGRNGYDHIINEKPAMAAGR